MTVNGFSGSSGSLRARWLARVVAVSLVASGFVAVASSGGGGGVYADPAPDPSAVEPLISDPVPSVSVDVSLGDFSDAPGTGPAPDAAGPADLEGFDESTSRLTGRTEFTNEFVNVDGTHTTVSSPVPINMDNGSGKIVPIQTKVADDGSGGGEVVVNPLAPKFKNADVQMLTSTRKTPSTSTTLAVSSVGRNCGTVLKTLEKQLETRLQKSK